MGKSKRSKVKMAYKAMRRQTMEATHDVQLREQASKIYKAIGLDMPEERPEQSKMPSRSHGGFELVSTFVETPKGPELNVVHGPLANKGALRVPKDVVGFPIVGAGLRARMRAEKPVPRKSMEVDDEEFEEVANTPYFYPRRARKSGSIRKQRREKVRTAARKGKSMEVEASA